MKIITIDNVEVQVSDEQADMILKAHFGKSDRPKVGEKCFMFDSDMSVDSFDWDGNIIDVAWLEAGNIFWGKDAEKACEYAALRMKSMLRKDKWLPGHRDEFWTYGFHNSGIQKEPWVAVDGDMLRYAAGMIHKTKEEAEEWGKTYSEAFEYEFKQ